MLMIYKNFTDTYQMVYQNHGNGFSKVVLPNTTNQKTKTACKFSCKFAAYFQNTFS